MSFRQFGGLNYAPKHNIVTSNYNTSNNLLVTQNVGQPNSYINFLSDISGNIKIYGDADISGNSTAQYMFLSSYPPSFATEPNDVMPKAYIDLVGSGIVPFGPVKAISTYDSSFSSVSNTYPINISNTVFPCTIDGISINPGDTVLLNDQGTNNGLDPSVNNGMYDLSFNEPTSYYFVRNSKMPQTTNTNVKSTVNKTDGTAQIIPLNLSSTGNIMKVPLNIATVFGSSTTPSLQIIDDNSSNTMYFIPNIGAGSYNPASIAGEQAIISFGEKNKETLSLTSWSDTYSAIKIAATSVSIGAGGSTSPPANSIIVDGSSNEITLSTNLKNILFINSTGNVGIGMNTPTNKLDVSGNIYATGNVSASSFITPSDYRIKENIQLLNENYTVDNLKPITYFNIKTEKQDIGLIAHELQEYFPCLVNGAKDAEEYQTVNYLGLIPILIHEIQCLKKEIKSLK